MIKKVNYFFQAIIVYLLFLIGRILGLKLARRFFSFLFSTCGPLFKSKKVIDNNLNIFSKELTINNKKQIINDMWKNYGMTFIEYIYLDYFKKKNSLVASQGDKNLLELTNQKSVIFISGHFANFELMSMEITKRNINLATIYRPLNNFFLNPFMEFLRKKYVCKNQIKKGINGVRDAINYIKKKYSIALMIDQRVSEGKRINFFNKEALTTTLPAHLSIKYNLKIVPVFIKRNLEGKFDLEFQNEIDPSNFTSKFQLSEKLNQILENMIKKNSGQWIWTHNRWK